MDALSAVHMKSSTALNRLIDRVRAAHASKTPLEIRGGGTKSFYGEVPCGERLSTLELSGISSYEPSELVVTARAGTLLVELEAALAEKGQCLPFEPPHFGTGATVGGMVAAGLTGPARAAVGSVRDYVLGATMLNGRGEVLTYGGQVMKNVAGYDVSRLLVGSLGILGIVCEVSLKVLPIRHSTSTLRFDCDQGVALERLAQWRALPLPIHASVWYGGVLHVRLRGAGPAVDSACKTLGGSCVDPTDAVALWGGLREQTGSFFSDAARPRNLWRLSVTPTAPALALDEPQLVEWGGGLRWIASDRVHAVIRDAAARAGGHATLFRTAGERVSVFAPLPPALRALHERLKAAFDPERILNRGRFYPEL